MDTQLSPTMENYLEAIHHVQHGGSPARVKDIASHLGVAMSSVTSALRTLSNEGLVRHEKYGLVELTDTGREIAEHIHRRHVTLAGFLTDILQLDPQQADAEACKLEHGLSPTALRRLMALLEFVKRCPRSGEDWLAHMRGRWEQRDCDHDCRRCIRGIRPPRHGPFGPRICARAPIPLSQCEPGFRGTIVRTCGRGPLRRRLVEMGVTPGTDVELERLAPLGDPMEIKLRGYHLSLRRDEAATVLVEPK